MTRSGSAQGASNGRQPGGQLGNPQRQGKVSTEVNPNNKAKTRKRAVPMDEEAENSSSHKCGVDQHITSQCIQDSLVSCLNCNGEHSSTDRKCPKRVEFVKFRQQATTKNQQNYLPLPPRYKIRNLAPQPLDPMLRTEMNPSPPDFSQEPRGTGLTHWSSSGCHRIRPQIMIGALPDAGKPHKFGSVPQYLRRNRSASSPAAGVELQQKQLQQLHGCVETQPNGLRCGDGLLSGGGTDFGTCPKGGTAGISRAKDHSNESDAG